MVNEKIASWVGEKTDNTVFSNNETPFTSTCREIATRWKTKKASSHIQDRRRGGLSLRARATTESVREFTLTSTTRTADSPGPSTAPLLDTDLAQKVEVRQHPTGSEHNAAERILRDHHR